MSKIRKIYDELYGEEQLRESRVFIDFYELNKDLIENTDSSLSNPDYDGIMRITADYALALSNYGSSKKAIPFLDKAIMLFENSSSEYLTAIPMYEMLKWVRGVENYNQKNYDLASKDFKYLVDHYPENDKYRNWLLGSKTIRIKKYLNMFWYGGLVALIWETIVNKENKELKDYLFVIAITLFCFAIVTEIINYAVKEKIKSKANSLK